MHFTIKILLFLALIALFLVGALAAFLKFHPVFGGKPDEETLQRIKASKSYDGKKFINAQPTKLRTGENFPSLLGWVLDGLNPPAGRIPAKPLPSLKFSAEIGDGEFVWLGHSSVLFRVGGKTFLTDPIFYSAAPLQFISRPFAYENAPQVKDMPRIDAVLISHDHYDHLDYKTIKELNSRVDRFFVPLGVGAHLLRWGVEASRITQLDLDESVRVGEATLTLVTTRHFSGRSAKSNNTLWGGWVIKTPEASLFFGGDGGYGEHFKQIAAAHAPFDLVMLENGAYNENWAQIHSMPEDTARAADELLAYALLPIHWAKFDLSTHDWDEPIKRLLKASENANFKLTTPIIGEVFTIQNLPQKKWWE